MNKQETRLQKYLARCGIASRRHCETLISEGRISVNNKVVTKLGTKIDSSIDEVKFDGNIVEPSYSNFSLVLNKPAGYVCTMNDPQGRPCVKELVPVDKYPSLFPVGRLDRLTKGMLVFTTDGQLGQTLLHPKHNISKCYEAIIDGKIKNGDVNFKKLEQGVDIKDFITSPAKLNCIEHFDFSKYLDYENKFFKNCAKKNDQESLPNEKDLLNKTFTRLTIEISEGKNRQVRRMFAALGFEVLLLTRKSIGNFKLDNLECGKWAKLKQEDIDTMLNK